MSKRFAHWLFEQLMARELSAAELSRLTGYSKSAISNWLAGDVTPSIRGCQRLAEALGTDLQTVLIAAGHAPEDSASIDLSRVDYRAAIRAQEPPEVAELMLRVLNEIAAVERERGERRAAAERNQSRSTNGADSQQPS